MVLSFLVLFAVLFAYYVTILVSSRAVSSLAFTRPVVNFTTGSCLGPDGYFVSGIHGEATSPVTSSPRWNCRAEDKRSTLLCPSATQNLASC
jgi:hypothetical protein